MFDIGGWEVLLAAALALILIQPKDLPQAMHKLGLIVGKMRRWVAEIQTELDLLVHDAEMKEITDRLKEEGMDDEHTP